MRMSNEKDPSANEAKLRDLLQEYLGTDKFQESQVVGHKRNSLRGRMCTKAMLAHHKCVFSLCELCFGKYAVSKKDKNQEKFVCINNGYGNCDEVEHEPGNLVPIDGPSVRAYMSDKHRQNGRGTLFCLPLRCSGNCGRWWIVDKVKL